MYVLVFFVNDTATTEIYTYGHTLSLPDALPISAPARRGTGPTSLGRTPDLSWVLAARDPPPSLCGDGNVPPTVGLSPNVARALRRRARRRGARRRRPGAGPSRRGPGRAPRRAVACPALRTGGPGHRPRRGSGRS